MHEFGTLKICAKHTKSAHMWKATLTFSWTATSYLQPNLVTFWVTVKYIVHCTIQGATFPTGLYIFTGWVLFMVLFTKPCLYNPAFCHGSPALWCNSGTWLVHWGHVSLVPHHVVLGLCVNPLAPRKLHFMTIYRTYFAKLSMIAWR